MIEFFVCVSVFSYFGNFKNPPCTFIVTRPFSALFTLQRGVSPCSLTYCCMYSILDRVRCACAAAISCPLVEVTDRGPTAVAGFQVHAVHLRTWYFNSVSSPNTTPSSPWKCLLHELVPAWRMLHSSTSALGHDQTDKHCLFNHMLSDCLVLGSHSCISTASSCPSRIAGSVLCALHLAPSLHILVTS